MPDKLWNEVHDIVEETGIKTIPKGKKMQQSKRLSEEALQIAVKGREKKIEENNRMGKTRDLFKIIRDTKGTFHARMGSIKDRNGMDLTEAEDIKKNWQEYAEELHKKDLHDPDNHDV